MLLALVGFSMVKGPAYAAFTEPIRALASSMTTLIQQFGSPAAASSAPSPTPSPGASATPIPFRRGGPLQFSLTGSASLGTNLQQTTATNTLGNLMAQSNAENEENVGLLAVLSRRTATSTATLNVPLGLSNEGGQPGTIQFLYSTPKYTLGYSAESVGLFGQVPTGGTLRGGFLTLPAGNGDVTFYGGPAQGNNLDAIDLFGVRVRHLFGQSLFELGIVQSTAGSQTGPSTTVELGGVGARGLSSLVGEVAYQTREADSEPQPGDTEDIVPSGADHLSLFADQFTYNYGATQNNWQVTLRSIPDRFLGYSGGELAGDDLVDVNWDRSFKSIALNLDVGQEATDSFGEMSLERRSSFNFSGSLGHDSYTLTVAQTRTSGDTPAEWNGTATLEFGVALPSGYLLLGDQLGRTTQYGLAPVGIGTLSAEFQKQFRKLAFQFTGQRERQTSNLLGPSTLFTQSYGATREFGVKTGIGFNYTVTRTQSAMTDSLQRTPLFSVTRQISPAIAVQASFGTQSLSDASNSAYNGHSRVFNVQLTAPFAFGNGAVQGRVDPRLPAIIEGRVVTDLGTNSLLTSYSGTGVGNVLIVMDGQQVQRTDLQGNFEFSFVSPGQHQIRVETSSVPRGLTVDQPVVTLQLEGGQTSQLYFRLGNYGSIVGHVFGSSENGVPSLPLANVLVRLDNGAYSQTDSLGTYGFGRLKPGDHTVEVIPNSVPAFATFAADAEKHSVHVVNGQIANVDFVGEPLGSIGGFVTFGPELRPNYQGGVTNAYVVAEPGEHAAITNDDGSYLIDNLPPGIYTVSVDPETVPDETGPDGSALTVTLGSSEHYEGASFLVGNKAKSVVFSFSGDQAPAELHVVASRLPPGGFSDVSVEAPAAATAVSVEAFDKTQKLVYDAARKVWRGGISVPGDAKDGQYPVTGHVTGGNSLSATGSLTVDRKIPLAMLQLTPANATPGQYVTVRARFLVDARAGDKIEWEDGTITTLSKPVSGRVFTFTIRIAKRPEHGTLLMVNGHLPVELQ